MPARGEKARYRFNHFFEANEEDLEKYSGSYAVFKDVLTVWFELENSETLEVPESASETGMPGFKTYIDTIIHTPNTYKLMHRDDSDNGPHIYEYVSIVRNKTLSIGIYNEVEVRIHSYTLYPDKTASMITCMYPFTKEEEKAFCAKCRYALKFYGTNKYNEALEFALTHNL